MSKCFSCGVAGIPDAVCTHTCSSCASLRANLAQAEAEMRTVHNMLVHVGDCSYMNHRSDADEWVRRARERLALALEHQRDELLAQLQRAEEELLRAHRLDWEVRDLQVKLAQAESEMGAMRGFVSRVANSGMLCNCVHPIGTTKLIQCLKCSAKQALSGEGGRKMLAVLEAAKAFLKAEDCYCNYGDMCPPCVQNETNLRQALKDLEG